MTCRVYLSTELGGCVHENQILAVLVVEVAAAYHGEAHLFGMNGRMEYSALIHPDFISCGTAAAKRGTHSAFMFHAGWM